MKTENQNGQAVLERETALIRNAQKGSRNQTLNKSSFALGQLVASEELDHDFAADRLQRAAQEAGIKTREAKRTVKSGLDAGMQNPQRTTSLIYAKSRQDRCESTRPVEVHESGVKSRREPPPTAPKNVAPLPDILACQKALDADTRGFAFLSEPGTCAGCAGCSCGAIGNRQDFTKNAIFKPDEKPTKSADL